MGRGEGQISGMTSARFLDRQPSGGRFRRWQETQEGHRDLVEEIPAADIRDVRKDVLVARVLEPIAEDVDVLNLQSVRCKEFRVLSLLEVARLKFLVNGAWRSLVLDLDDEDRLFLGHKKCLVRQQLLTDQSLRANSFRRKQSRVQRVLWAKSRNGFPLSENLIARDGETGNPCDGGCQVAVSLEPQTGSCVRATFAAKLQRASSRDLAREYRHCVLVPAPENVEFTRRHVSLVTVSGILSL